MEGQGSNSNAMDRQSNEKNQFTTEALDRESEEWMEECRSILNSDAPISFQNLLAEGGIFSPPRGDLADKEILPQMNSELHTAPSQNNDNRGKDLIILDDESEDDSVDAIRQSYKRKLPDGSSHQMLAGESSRAPEQREIQVSQEEITMVNNQGTFIDLEKLDGEVQDVEGPPLMHQPPNGAGNGTAVGEGTVPQMQQTPNPIGQAWVPQRNIRPITTGPRHGFLPVYSPFSGRYPQNQTNQYSPTGFALIRPNAPVSAPMQPSEMPPPYRPAYYDHMDSQPFYQQVNWSTSYNNSNINGPAPGMQMRNTPSRPTNMTYQPFPGNVASSSRNVAASHAYRPSSVSWNPQENFDQFQRAQRTSLAANHQADQWRPSYYGPFRTASVSRPSEFRAPARSANLWPELTMASLRQAGIPPDVAMSLLTAAERARLLNEIRNSLRLLRGNFELVQFEFDNLVGENDDDDEHGDLRLDLDEYSFEDLLVLEQNIGNVSTGLDENVIEDLLRSRKYRTAAFGSPSDNPPCCICQEEYAEGDDTAKLLCGHYFHFDCIKKWLVEKNNCPICKNIAINV